MALDIDGGKIYWSDYSYNNPRIRRANLDGTEIEDLATGSSGCVMEGVVLNIAEGRLYWGGDNAIHSSQLDGDDVQTVVADLPDSPRSIEIDTESDQIYWTTTSLSSGFVQRINLNGSGLTTLVSGTRGSYGLALDGSLVKTLVDGWRAEGPYEVRWNGCNSDGRSLASGVYLSRLVNKVRMTTRSVTLVR